MIFILKRTSLWSDDTTQPHPKAVKRLFKHYDIRTECFGSSAYNLEDWYKLGTEHCRLDNGYYRRRLNDTEKWSIEINTLEGLMDFINNNGFEDRVVVSGKTRETANDNESIEIYDDYRE